MTRRLGFILAENYSLMSIAAAIEPLRAANLLAGRELYVSTFLSSQGGMRHSSSGGGFDTVALGQAPFDFDIAFVVAGGNPMTYDDPALVRFLRRLAANNVPLGGLSGGGVILARAGLMLDRRFTVHWQHVSPLLELNPDFRIERRLFVIDRDRYTCAGGVAVLDMMGTLIGREHGEGFARSVSEWFIYSASRGAETEQEGGHAYRHGIRHSALATALSIMTSHMLDPLSPAQIAMLSGSSLRQLHRLFADRFDTPMMTVYRALRLEKADELLQQTGLPVSEIGVMTGFPNAAHFSRVFTERYGLRPTERRREAMSRNRVEEAPVAPMPRKD